ncbi:hypothetical protein RB10199 [Rhodopirellula baltica SH 1]|uniref:Uncharacterized protein n=1 Tax=Rhodopirellula baltica (strain DSM 10527 / NCIMB 13988 / SH1) TaxID=243090 RepID=Q7UFC6_RHOBA|nr:hypothetical protein RB10199 [Rhodopirellula baltica SH 1]
MPPSPALWLGEHWHQSVASNQPFTPFRPPTLGCSVRRSSRGAHLD